MDIKETKLDNISVFSLSGRLDATNSDEFQARMLHEVNTGQQRFVFDLLNLDYISSSGLRAFLAISKSISQEGFVRFVNIKDQVEEVFSISGFNTIFEVMQSVDDHDVK